MNWFYVTKEKTQAGPVDEAALAELLQSGAISKETLIWKTGMENWTPYAAIFDRPGQVAAVSPAGDGESRCTECGQAFPADQLISLAGRPVCAACKPMAVQKFQEGVLSFGPGGDAEELWSRVKQRGFNFTIGSALGGGWEVVKGNFWPAVGVTLLCYLITLITNQIPFLGFLAVFLVQPQMMAGIQWYFLKQIRREEATLNDAFSGFRRGFGQQALYMLVVFAVIIGVAIVCAIPLVLFAIPGIQHHSTSMVSFIPLLIVIPMLIAMAYIMLTWLFTSMLILDKGLNALPAMKLSRRVVHLQFWRLVGLFVVLFFLGLLGFIALVIGIIFVLPVAFATMARIYEDAFGETRPSIQN